MGFSFFTTGILFFMIGMGFGTSFSLVYVDCLDWVHTSFKKKLLRGILAGVVAAGIKIGFQNIPCNDNPTRYFFWEILPNALISFLCYGVLPIVCKRIGLVEEKIREEEE